MNQDFTYYGLFKVDENSNGIVITTRCGDLDYVTMTTPGMWYRGHLTVSADGNFVEVEVDEAYRVFVSWSSFSYESGLEISDLVYIDNPVHTTRWFGLSEHVFYPAHTRYIVDYASTERGIQRYFNHPVTLITQ